MSSAFVGALAAVSAVAAFVLARRRRIWQAAAWPMLLVVVWTIVNAALYIARVNHTFLHGIYFVVPVLATALACSGAADLDRRTHMALAALGAVVLVVFSGLRFAKYLDIALTWQQRDPVPLEQFVRSHVPPGSIVYGDDQFYLYAVERSGSRFMAYVPNPFPGSPTIGRPPAEALAAIRRQFAGHYLIWPDDPRMLMPAMFSCVKGHEVAEFVPPHSSSPNIMNRIGAFGRYAYLRAYPRSVLYIVPDNCPPASPSGD